MIKTFKALESLLRLRLLEIPVTVTDHTKAIINTIEKYVPQEFICAYFWHLKKKVRKACKDIFGNILKLGDVPEHFPARLYQEHYRGTG